MNQTAPIQFEEQDAIIWLAKRTYQKDASPVEKAKQKKSVAALLAKVQDPFLRSEYVKAVKRELKITGTGFEKLTEEANRNVLRAEPRNTNREQSEVSGDTKYRLPRGVDVSWEKVKKDVKEYGFFSHKNTLWFMVADGNDEASGEIRYTFKERSNFDIKIIQHMEDAERPMHLYEIKNKRGERKVFDSSTDNVVSEASFKKMIAGVGNFQWLGKGDNFDRLGSKLMDKMGTGTQIHIIGWQEEGFWALNNMCLLTDGTEVEPDVNGIVTVLGNRYYIPSGNKLYEKAKTKFVLQKQMEYVRPTISLKEFYERMVGVFGEDAYVAMMFGISSAFSDVVYDSLKAFPLLFLYGPPGTGKDLLIHATQSLFGRQQTAMELNSDANTPKAFIRHTAQFRNQVMHWSEFENTPKIANKMKGVFDRKGYGRARVDSTFATDFVPVNSTIMYTGNYYPNNDAQLDRSIVLEMDKSEHTSEQKKRYDEFDDIIKEGVSGFLREVIQLRGEFENTFKKHLRESTDKLQDRFKEKGLNISSRMTKSAAMLVAAHRISNNRLPIPFSEEELINYICKIYEKQMEKRGTASALAKFWDYFLQGIRDKHNPIRENFDFKLEGKELRIQWTSVYQHYKRMCKEAPEAKSFLADTMRRQDYFVGLNASEKFNTGDKVKRSSSWSIEHDKVSPTFTEDLMDALRVYELNQTGQPPKPTYDDMKPSAQMKVVGGNDNADDDLPF